MAQYVDSGSADGHDATIINGVEISISHLPDKIYSKPRRTSKKETAASIRHVCDVTNNSFGPRPKQQSTHLSLNESKKQHSPSPPTKSLYVSKRNFPSHGASCESSSPTLQELTNRNNCLTLPRLQRPTDDKTRPPCESYSEPSYSAYDTESYRYKIDSCTKSKTDGPLTLPRLSPTNRQLTSPDNQSISGSTDEDTSSSGEQPSTLVKNGQKSVTWCQNLPKWFGSGHPPIGLHAKCQAFGSAAQTYLADRYRNRRSASCLRNDPALGLVILPRTIRHRFPHTPAASLLSSLSL